MRVTEGRNGGKKMASLPFFTYGFSGENPRLFLQTFDAPSMALLVLVGKKWQVSS